MHPAIAQAATTFLIAAMLAAYVALRRDKSSLHWLFLSLLLALLIWSGGAVLRHSASTESELQTAFRVMFLGIYAVPALWLLLAARFARLQQVEERPAVVALALAPALLFYGLYLTNPHHHWMAARIDLEAFEYGPLFWPAAGWGYACVIGGLLLLVRRARRLAVSEERWKATLLAGAAMTPVLANASYLTGVVRWPHDPTPLSLGFSAAVLFALVSRYQLLENLPLVRRDVIEHLREGVLIADPSGEIVDTNPAAERILGRPAADLRGRALRQVMAVHTHRADAASVDRLLESLGDEAVPRDAEIRTPDDRRIELSAAVVRGRSGDPAGRFVMLRDRTEARRFEGRIRQTQRLESVGLLAAGIAHEVNNPLAFVRANLVHLHRLAQLVEANAALLAKDGEVGGENEELEELPRVVEETLEGVERIAHIVASLRRLARSEQEQLGPVDLNQVVQESVKLAGLHRAPGVEVATRLAEALPPVSGSRDRLIQVFLNLLLNAKQALTSRGGGSVIAETRVVEAAVEVRIADDGPGMSERVQQRIFDAFFTTKAPDEGTGLGLPIAFDIVRDHGGWMEVASGPGEGACFTVRLPLVPESEEPPAT